MDDDSENEMVFAPNDSEDGDSIFMVATPTPGSALGLGVGMGMGKKYSKTKGGEGGCCAPLRCCAAPTSGRDPR